MIRRIFLGLLPALIVVAACAPDAAPDGRPSFVLLVADDLGRTDLGAYGNTRVTTPAIDGLAAEGIRFDAAFTATALCQPSRFTIYTGLHPHQSGVDRFFELPEDLELLHEELDAAGYRTGLLAKFGSKIQHLKPFDFSVDRPELDNGHDLEGIARAARRFFAESIDEPFFLIVGFGDPHTPYPDEPFCSPEEVTVPGHLPDLPGIRETIARYYASIARLDRGVGLVLEELDRAGRKDDTVVFFTSDHGPAFPFAKSTLYDAGVGVPLIVRWPQGIRGGRHTAALAHFVDLRPTFLGLAGVEEDGPAIGHSLLPILRGESASVRDQVFLSHSANLDIEYPMRAVRTRRFKYIRNFTPETTFVARLENQAAWQEMLAAAASDPAIAERVRAFKHRPPEELYDLEADPSERVNRIDDAELADELSRLRNLLRRTMERTDDPLRGS